MKVTRKEPKPVFMPITIVLETEKEAAEFWHRFNIGCGQSFDEYLKEHLLPNNDRTSFQMWSAINKVFRPKGWR